VQDLSELFRIVFVILDIFRLMKLILIIASYATLLAILVQKIIRLMDAILVLQLNIIMRELAMMHARMAVQIILVQILFVMTVIMIVKLVQDLKAIIV
jgi:hypothetical protein